MCRLHLWRTIHAKGQSDQRALTDHGPCMQLESIEHGFSDELESEDHEFECIQRFVRVLDQVTPLPLRPWSGGLRGTTGQDVQKSECLRVVCAMESRLVSVGEVLNSEGKRGQSRGSASQHMCTHESDVN
jgi:hypothetical protein